MNQASITAGAPQKPLWKIFIAFLVPMIFSNVLQSLSGTVNTIYVGQMLGVNAMAATTSFFPIMFLLIAFLLGLSVGATVLIGQAWGAQDLERVTNVGATVAALNGLGASRGGDRKRLLLIAGGDGKGQDFAPLTEPVSAYARAVLLIGADAGAIRVALSAASSAAPVELIDCASMEEAVQQAAARAQSGDQVLLSPACASFDMFNNYAHRAQVFVDAVREVAMARGEIGL